jgi:hypothetical protein
MDLVTSSCHQSAVVIFAGDAQEYVAAELGNLEPRDRADRMVHPVKDEQIEVAKIPGDCEVANLPPSILERAIMTAPSLQDQIN